MDTIHSYVDDIAFFSALLCSDLIEHGKRVREGFTKKFGKGAPKVSTADFSGPRQKGLIPPDSQYVDWRLLDLNHASRMEHLESAARSLGREIRLSVV